MNNSNTIRIVQWFKRPLTAAYSLLQFFNNKKASDISVNTPTIIPRDQHSISRKNISRPALNVLYGLHEAGFEAYLVGGCLRDLLTGIQPKDYDIVTNARPEEAKAVFRRSRIIGRRFRLVHVYFGREVIEVATFRSSSTEHEDSDDLSHSKSGRILRDNVYGSIEEDAIRRDFTINALYYNINGFTLHDFTHSIADIKAGVIRLIGDPETRYREDPVRMLRAARFAAKLGFTIEPNTLSPIKPLAHLMQQIPPARLFDESNKLFLSGHGRQSLIALRKYDLFKTLFPTANKHLLDEASSFPALLEHALANTDERILDGRPVTPAFLFAVIMWPEAQRRQKQKLKAGLPPVVAMTQAASETISEQVQTIAIPRRFSNMVREIWELQERLPRRQGQRAFRLQSHPRFRAAYDFLLLREQAEEIPAGLGEWWTAFQAAKEGERKAMVAALRNPRTRKRRRAPRTKRS